MVQATQGRVSEARSRLLETATRIFYTEGIHAVGIDRIVAEAKVTRATLYRHFPSKEELVVAYLDAVHHLELAQVQALINSGRPAPDVLRSIAESITAGITSGHFRGCAFLNAAAEYPDAEHPVHKAILAHREWFADTITSLFAQIGETPPEPAARHYVMMRDGAMAAGCLADPTQVGATFLEGVEGLLTFRAKSA
jgi:AcrR family transcriptional regulator